MKDFELNEKGRRMPRKTRQNEPEHARKMSQGQIKRLQKKCGCNSGKPFQSCCFREDHKEFALDQHLEMITAIKSRFQNRAIYRLLEGYRQSDPQICTSVDIAVKTFNIPHVINSFDQLSHHVTISSQQGIKLDGNTDSWNLMALIDVLTLDSVLPDVSKSIFQITNETDALNASSLESECFTSFSSSQISIYEVIKVKKDPLRNLNSWYLIRDLFTGRKYELKDASFNQTLFLWDIIIGRLYSAEGFYLLSNPVIIVSHSNKGIFNRMLLRSWYLYETSKPGRCMDDLLSKYPSLFQDFDDTTINLEESGLYHRDLLVFLKQRPMEIYGIIDIMEDALKRIPSMFIRIDGQPIPSITIKCRLNNIHTARLLRASCERSDAFQKCYQTDCRFGFFCVMERPVSRSNEPHPFSFRLIVRLGGDDFANAVVQACRTKLRVRIDDFVDGGQEGKCTISYTKDSSGGHAIGIIGCNYDEIMLSGFRGEDVGILRELVEHIIGKKLEWMQESQDIEITRIMQKAFDDRDDISDYTLIDHHDGIASDEENVNEACGADDDGEFEEDEYSTALSKPEIDRNVDALLKHGIASWFQHVWVDTPSAFLEGKVPRTCCNDEQSRPILIDAVKSIENQLDRQGLYDEMKSLWTLLNLGKKPATLG